MNKSQLKCALWPAQTCNKLNIAIISLTFQAYNYYTIHHKLLTPLTHAKKT